MARDAPGPDVPCLRSFIQNYLRLYSFDVRSKLAQFLIEMFVAAIDMINAADFGSPFGFQPSQDKCRGSPEIARHDRRAKQPLHALNDGGGCLELHVSAHPL